MNNLITITKKIGYDNNYFLIVPDHAAGRRNRYTIYRIPSSPSRKTKIIGRELPLGFCKKLIGEIIK